MADSDGLAKRSKGRKTKRIRKARLESSRNGLSRDSEREHDACRTPGRKKRKTKAAHRCVAKTKRGRVLFFARSVAPDRSLEEKDDAPSSTSSSAQLAPALSSTAAAAASMLARRRAPEGNSGRRELFCSFQRLAVVGRVDFFHEEWHHEREKEKKKKLDRAAPFFSFSSSFSFLSLFFFSFFFFFSLVLKKRTSSFLFPSFLSPCLTRVSAETPPFGPLSFASFP